MQLQQLQQITVGQLIGYVRDLSIAFSVMAVAWKARGFWDRIEDFVDRVNLHMDRVELTLNTLITNHLGHISESLDKLVKTDGPQVPTNEQHR